MNGDNLIPIVREVLKDVATNVSQGEFWADREIIIALNAAQDIFLIEAIKNKLHYLLAALVTNTTHVQGQRAFVFNPQFLYYISAKVGAELSEKPARIYYGGEAVYYLNTRHKACAITGNDVFFVDSNSTPPRNGEGVLYYYKRPSYIGATSLGDNTRPDFNQQDFEDFIYQDLFANQAAVLLGIKETTNQRDFKKKKRYITELVSNPVIYANYIKNHDFSGFIPKPKQEEKK